MLISNQLIDSYVKDGHSLGKKISQGEIPTLISSLRKRLLTTEADLDLSFSSFKKLEKCLADFCSSFGGKEIELSQDDQIILLRELIAYLGETLVNNVDAKWDETSLNLSDTAVVITGPWKIRKNNKKYISPHPTTIILAGEAAYLWNSIILEKPSSLRQLVLNVQRKSMRERL